MTLTGLAVRNLARNPFRAFLTAAAVAIATVAFLLLRTVNWAWAAGGEFAAKDRVVTRHKVTFGMPLPKHHVEIVRSAPHVKSVTWATWFGGKDPRHPNEFFGTYAVDPGSYFGVYDEAVVVPDQLETWKHDRQGAIVGDMLAKKLGWKVGDRISLESEVFPGQWSFSIDSIYTATARSVDRSSVVIHWDYLNDGLPETQRDGVGIIVARVDAPARSASVALALDRMFEDGDAPTLSQDERNFNTSFLGMFSAILDATSVVSGIILGIMTLILANTIAMGVRERTSEYGVLRAIGFLPGHVALWVVGESLVVGAAGGAIGVGVAWPFIDLVAGRFVDENMGLFFRCFHLVRENVVLALALATALGGTAAVIPAWRAAQLRVVDAVRKVA